MRPTPEQGRTERRDCAHGKCAHGKRLAKSRGSDYNREMAKPRPTIQLGQFCAALRVRPRDARYILEQGYVPLGVDVAPNSGTYRQFDPRQAFWLAMVAKLKESGVAVPLGAKIARYSEESLGTLGRRLGWDPQFGPDLGRLETEYQYVAEIAERKYIRIGSDAGPGAAGQVRFFDWHHIDRIGRPVSGLRPCVVLRLNLTEIARQVEEAFGGQNSG